MVSMNFRSLKVSSLKITLVSQSVIRGFEIILRCMYTLWSTCLNTIYHHYRHHHHRRRRAQHQIHFLLLYIGKSKKKKMLSIRIEEYLLKYLSLSAKVCIFLLNCTLQTSTLNPPQASSTQRETFFLLNNCNLKYHALCKFEMEI